MGNFANGKLLGQLSILVLLGLSLASCGANNTLSLNSSFGPSSSSPDPTAASGGGGVPITQGGTTLVVASGAGPCASGCDLKVQVETKKSTILSASGYVLSAEIPK